jgi:histidine triad (HIT) family protein
MNDCIFCKIVVGEIPSTKVYEDQWVVAFKDINPVAPVHIQVIPKEHIKSVAEFTEDHINIAGRLLFAASEIGREHCGDNGFRVVTNIGDDGGQEVKHLHLHVIGGRKMTWPPG